MVRVCNVLCTRLDSTRISASFINIYTYVMYLHLRSSVPAYLGTVFIHFGPARLVVQYDALAMRNCLRRGGCAACWPKQRTLQCPHTCDGAGQPDALCCAALINSPMIRCLIILKRLPSGPSVIGLNSKYAPASVYLRVPIDVGTYVRVKPKIRTRTNDYTVRMREASTRRLTSYVYPSKQKTCSSNYLLTYTYYLRCAYRLQFQSIETWTTMRQAKQAGIHQYLAIQLGEIPKIGPTRSVTRIIPYSMHRRSMVATTGRTLAE